MKSFAPLLSAAGGGDTGAPETKANPIPREWYHTDWVADHTVAYLDSLDDDENFFVWMSFPDPHHPWDPPESELGRVNWRDLDLPPGHPGSPEAIRKVLAEKPAHWLAWYEDQWANIEGGPSTFKPAEMTHDQVREVNAKTHVMNELIDEACGRVIDHLAALGRLDDTDIFFTTDHGELQGDFGLLFKGPFHVDALMRLPFVWRPAPSAGIDPAVVTDPVGQVDLAPTFCQIAGIDPPEWMQGRPLPATDGTGRENVICEWDSQFSSYGMHLRSVYRDGWMCTVYEPKTGGEQSQMEKLTAQFILGMDQLPEGIPYDGTEGELYDLTDDPHQFHNRWDDPACASLKADLIADLYDTLPTEVRHLKVEAPA
jgi:arylsulfatase A-like enzyme